MYVLLLYVINFPKNSLKGDFFCKIITLALCAKVELIILIQIAEIKNVIKENKDKLFGIGVLSVYTKKELSLMCKS